MPHDIQKSFSFIEYSSHLKAMDGFGFLAAFSALSRAALMGSSASGGLQHDGRWLIGGFLGESIPILGSDETRRGFGICVEYERPEPKFVFPKGVGDLVWEGYIESTYGGPDGGNRRDRLNALGILAMARWRWHQSQRSLAFFTDLGWGFVIGNRTTVDLDSQVNSTPLLDFGIALGPRQREWLVGLRFLHMSDAGLKGRNQGQNQVHLFVAKRY